MIRKLAILFGSCVLATGTCAVESWKLAVGPVVNGETVYGGVELELRNGLDLVIPVAPLGDSLGNGWLGD